jgi:hypothetical protein
MKMVPAQYPPKKEKYGHIPVRVVECPECGFQLHFTSRTVMLACQCGKIFKVMKRAACH